MAVEAQWKLFEALQTHIAKLEADRDRAQGPNQAVLIQRLESAVKALEWLRKARKDIEQGEDNGVAKGLRDKAFSHIDEAIKLTQKAAQS